MKNRHLIALDLDGTLLTDKKTISLRSKQTIQQAREQGHIVVIATGRPHRASSMYYRELALDTPMVNFNGAYTHHPLDANWDHHHSPLELNTAREIIHALQPFNVRNILAEVLDDVYLQNEDHSIKEIFSAGNPLIRTGNLHELLAEDPTSLLIHPHDEQIADIRTHLKEVHADVIEHRTWGAPWNVIEIVQTGIHKAYGLDRIAKHYNISPDKVIAFGDEDNDLEMLEYAGQGVAMGNGIDTVKTIANFTTKSNEEDGVALYLEEALLLNKKRK
jgi:5-amino-6-(5-phospho-D-ribitylamino)uracil phosphatase